MALVRTIPIPMFNAVEPPISARTSDLAVRMLLILGYLCSSRQRFERRGAASSPVQVVPLFDASSDTETRFINALILASDCLFEALMT